MSLLPPPNGVNVYSTIDALCLRVCWGAVDGACVYNVYYSAIPHDSFVLVGDGVPGLTFFHNPQKPLNLNIRNSWYYAVSSLDSNGEGGISPPSTFLPYQELAATDVPGPSQTFWNLIS